MTSLRHQCPHCGLFKEGVGTDADEITHMICARCYYGQWAVNSKENQDPELLDEVKGFIKEEIEQNTRWIGEDKFPFSEKIQQEYDELVLEVRREIGEGSEGRKYNI